MARLVRLADLEVDSAVAVDGSYILKVDTGGGAVTVTPNRGPLTDGSGTVTAGGTSQQVFAANPTRNYLFVLNPSTNTDTLWINFGIAAVTSRPSIPLTPGQSFVMESSFIDNQSVAIIGPTTGVPFIAKQG